MAFGGITDIRQRLLAFTTQHQRRFEFLAQFIAIGTFKLCFRLCSAIINASALVHGQTALCAQIIQTCLTFATGELGLLNFPFDLDQSIARIAQSPAGGFTYRKTLGQRCLRHRHRAFEVLQ